jgi:tRNA C32,U32 (ribose-2'-O)-methylase TrmJ
MYWPLRRSVRLDDILEDCRLVIGASARTRSIPCPVLTPRECAPMVRRKVKTARWRRAAASNPLSNAEIDRCHYLVQIPASSIYGSLNLAAAVQVIAYEIFVAHVTRIAERAVVSETCPRECCEMERFYDHLAATLVNWDSSIRQSTAPDATPAFV